MLLAMYRTMDFGLEATGGLENINPISMLWTSHQIAHTFSRLTLTENCELDTISIK